MSNEQTAAIVPIEARKAGELMRNATDVAGVCREIVTRTAQSIQGKKYVKVEGWQAIATAYGCVASARDVEKVDGGLRAIGEIRRMSDGAVLATAEGFVGDDEKTWSARPEFARRAMAQTRAISRACRSAFAFVVVLIDSNLSTTPYEEMAGIEDAPIKPTGQTTSELKAKVAAKAAGVVEGQVVAPRPSPPRQSRMQIQDGPPPPGDEGKIQASRAPAAKVTLGLHAGKYLDEIDDLSWLQKVYEENVSKNDPKWHSKNVERLEALKTELRRRQQ